MATAAQATAAAKGALGPAWGWATSGKVWGSAALVTVMCAAAAPAAVAAPLAAVANASSVSGVLYNSGSLAVTAVTQGGPQVLTSAANTASWGAAQIAHGATWAAGGPA